MGTVFGREPVVILAVVQAGLGLGMNFGLNLTPTQQTAILTVSGALLALLARSQVTPTTTT